MKHEIHQWKNWNPLIFKPKSHPKCIESDYKVWTNFKLVRLINQDGDRWFIVFLKYEWNISPSMTVLMLDLSTSELENWSFNVVSNSVSVIYLMVGVNCKWRISNQNVIKKASSKSISRHCIDKIVINIDFKT